MGRPVTEIEDRGKPVRILVVRSFIEAGMSSRADTAHEAKLRAATAVGAAQ
jgi:hypothetical protein